MADAPRTGPAPDDEKNLRAHLVENLQRLDELLAKVPASGEVRAKIAELRRLLAEQRPPRLALVGRRGSGKSSLVNAIFGARIAEVGHEKAETGRGTWHAFVGPGGTLEILDTRGLQEGSKPTQADDAATPLESILREVRWKAPDAILFLVKASDVDAAIDVDIELLVTVWRAIEDAHRVKAPIVAVVTHADQVEPKNARLHARASEDPEEIAEKLERIDRIGKHLRGKLDATGWLRDHLVTVMGVSAYQSFRADGTRRADERWQVDELVSFLFKELPDQARVELARLSQVRSLQESIALRITHLCAASCAAVGAAPIPMADILPITSLQMSMILGIGYVAGREMTMRAATEFATAMGVNVGAGLLFRQAARQVVKLVPGAGAIVSFAMAYAGTYALGKAAIAYFVWRASREEAKAAYDNAYERAKESGAPPDDDPGPR